MTLVRAAGGGTPDTQFLMRAHRRLLTLAQGQREPLILNETPSADQPGRLSVPGAVLLAALARRALPSACWRCCAMRPREAFTERDAHIARDPRAQGHRRHREQLRRLERPVHACRVRAARARRGRGHEARAALERALHRRRPAARHQREVRHARRRRLLGQLGELIRQRLPPGAFGARISGDRFAVMLPAQVDDAERFAESLREGPSRLALVQAEGARAGVDQRRRRARSIPPPPSSRTCSRPPRPPARPPRTAAATASRSISRAMPASCAAMPTSASPASCARRSTRAGCTSTRSSSCRSPPPRARARTTSCCCA